MPTGEQQNAKHSAPVLRSIANVRSEAASVPSVVSDSKWYNHRKSARTAALAASPLQARQFTRGASHAQNKMQGLLRLQLYTCRPGNSFGNRVTLEKISKDCSACSITLARKAIHSRTESHSRKTSKDCCACSVTLAGKAI